jgi:PKHD-type hydroxylase
MKGEWCYYKSFFTHEECELILSQCKQLIPKKGSLGRYNTYDSNIRKSQIAFFDKDMKEFKWVFDKLWNLVEEGNKIWFDVDINNFHNIQFSEYCASYNGEYKKHHDVFWINDTNSHRKISLIVQLSDPNEYEGGDFEFFDLTEYPDKNDIKAKGTVLLFPSFHNHCANMVTKGVRYSLASWIEGPKWR